MKKIHCILPLFEIFLWLATFPILTRAEISDTTIHSDLMPSSWDMKDYCFTPECIHTASRVLRDMDTSINPCDDFYKFSCGQFINENNKHGYSHDHSIIIQQNIDNIMKNYLRKETLPDEPRYARLIKTFYNNCINELNSENETDFNSILELINKAGGWPLLKNNSLEDENFQWEKFGSQMDNITILENTFLTTILFDDPKYSSNRILKIQQPTLFYTSYEAYYRIIQTAQLLGVQEDVAKNIFKEINKVDQKLFNISVKKKDRSSTFEKMTVKQLMEKYSNILWKEFFNTFLKPNTISDDDVILVRDIAFFNEFNELIKNITKKDQANYLMWRATYIILENYAKSLSSSNPSEICYDSVKTIFEKSFGALYFKKFFKVNSNLENVDEMFDNIYEQFNNTLYNNNWMDNVTKLKALEKLESMFIVRPTDYFSHNDSEIDEFYKNLEITPGDYFQSLINIKKSVKYTMNVDIFRKPLKIRSWLELPSATIVNGQAIMELNRFVTPPAIFQGIFFNEKRPQYMNYGAVGSGIGHEMLHNFDNNGRKYDKEGFKENWWNPESFQEFLSKAQCIINQYNNYTVEEVGLNINGEQTQQENIADNEGIKIAYLAYEKYMRTHGVEPLLPGVNYTQRQLFWISFAQMYCETHTHDEMFEFLNDDTHSPNEFRVLGSLSNRPEFASDFQCALGTKMNPENKCSVW
ncbi:neprilysin-2-like [Leptopilina heterotoma]|uniref:neprilysin-2-like n=1 Tax=Leptopilina heterotoma TaxID=63436 RepID=UPI001CA93BA7|nr:neprilysin-2-like [Leptopilina heterotoma]